MQTVHTHKRLTRSFIAASSERNDETGRPIKIKILEQKIARDPRRPARGAITRVIRAIGPRGIPDDVVRKTLAEQLAYDAGRRALVIHKLAERVWKVIVRVTPDQQPA